MGEVVLHECRIRNKILQFELKQLCSRLFLIQEVQRMDLLQHLVFYNLAPDAFNLVRPVGADATDPEQFSRVHEPKHILLHDRYRDSCDALFRRLPYEEARGWPGPRHRILKTAD